MRDPAFDAVAHALHRIERVADELSFSEGPLHTGAELRAALEGEVAVLEAAHAAAGAVLAGD